MDNILLGAVILMGTLFLLSTAFFGSQYNMLYADNTTNVLLNSTGNYSVIGGQGGNQVPQFPVCDLGDNIVSNILGVGGCIANGVGWMFSLLSFRSDFQWLSVIFIGIGAVILYRIVRILKPTGGS